MPYPFADVHTKILSDTATIANGGNLSGAINLNGLVLCGLQMPAQWTAADIDFHVSVDGVTYGVLYDDTGTRYAVTVAASRSVALDTTKFYGWTFVKLHSATVGAATDVAQGAARSITVVARKG